MFGLVDRDGRTLATVKLEKGIDRATLGRALVAGQTLHLVALSEEGKPAAVRVVPNSSPRFRREHPDVREVPLKRGDEGGVADSEEDPPAGGGGDDDPAPDEDDQGAGDVDSEVETVDESVQSIASGRAPAAQAPETPKGRGRRRETRAK